MALGRGTNGKFVLFQYKKCPQNYTI